MLPDLYNILTLSNNTGKIYSLWTCRSPGQLVQVKLTGNDCSNRHGRNGLNSGYTKREIGMNALVVDDSTIARKVLTSALLRIGITHVAHASDGLEAVDAVKENDFTIVLMDWNMPNMSGIDAVKSIRAMGSDVPILMVTTESERSRIVEALKAGADNYVIKPFSSDIIDGKIQTVLKLNPKSY